MHTVDDAIVQHTVDVVANPYRRTEVGVAFVPIPDDMLLGHVTTSRFVQFYAQQI